MDPEELYPADLYIEGEQGRELFNFYPITISDLFNLKPLLSKSRKLTKRERKYRTKIIQEHHLKKSGQRLLDAEATRGASYEQIYCEIPIWIAIQDAARAIHSITIGFNEFTKAFCDFARKVSEGEGQ